MASNGVNTSSSSVSSAAGWGCAVFFWLFWTSLVGLFDVVLIVGICSQVRSYTYIPVEAVLLESRVEAKSDGESTSYNPVVKFRYHVAGTEYQGEKLRYLDMNFGSQTIHKQLPKTQVGEKLTAYYDPLNPARAILNPGFVMTDWVVFIFLLPFNVVSIVGLVFFLDWYRSKNQGYGFLAFSKWDDGVETRVRFYGVSPFLGALGMAGAGAFLMTFAVVMIPDAWVPDDIRVFCALSLIAVAMVYGWRWSSQSFSEVTYHAIRNEWSITKMDKDGQPQVTALTQPPQLSIKEKVTTDSDGDKSIKYPLLIDSPGMLEFALQEFTDYASAERMAEWLATKGLSYQSKSKLEE